MFMTEVESSSCVTGKPSLAETTTTLIGVPRKVPSSSYLGGQGEGEGSSSSEAEDSPPHRPASVLKSAGVELNLDTLTADGNHAPMELLSQVLINVSRDPLKAGL